MCQYRAVGHPIATAVTEGLVEMAAARIGMDPLEIRRRNLIPDDAHPSSAPSGIKFEALSHHESLAHLDAMMNYAGLRAEKRLREQGIHRGIGFASFIEVTNPSAAFYGVGGAKISAQDGVTIKLDAQGAIICQTGVTEQGQGAEAVIAQVAATAFGVPIERVRVITGDTDSTPYGGGTWASRAAGIGGEAAWQAGKALRANVLACAASILQATPSDLDIRDGVVVDRASGTERLPLSELARIAYFRPDTLPPGFQAELVATRHYVPRAWPFAFTNGIQASYLEVDVDSGFVKLIKHWCVEDCGTVINPQLVDEQIRAASCRASAARCSSSASTTSAASSSTATWRTTWCRWPPRCRISRSATWSRRLPIPSWAPRARARPGTAGAPGAVMNAINDALRPLGARALTDMPFTPGKILQALGKV